jgi:hypothetical protein
MNNVILLMIPRLGTGGNPTVFGYSGDFAIGCPFVDFSTSLVARCFVSVMVRMV